MTNSKWEKEFDRIFPIIVSSNLKDKKDDDEMWDEYKINLSKRYKDFIRTTIKQAVEEERERIKKKSLRLFDDTYHYGHGGTYITEKEFDTILSDLLKEEAI